MSKERSKQTAETQFSSDRSAVRTFDSFLDAARFVVVSRSNYDDLNDYLRGVRDVIETICGEEDSAETLEMFMNALDYDHGYRHKEGMLYDDIGHVYEKVELSSAAAEESALMVYLSEQYGQVGKALQEQARTDFEARYPGRSLDGASHDSGESSLTLEELKQRYFQRYKYDPRLLELFDLIPSYKLRQYLIEKVRKTPSIYLKNCCKLMNLFK